MKRLIYVLMLMTSISVYSTEKSSYTIITEEWPPYNYSDNGEIKGFAYEIVKYILNDLKIESRVEIMSPKRADYILENSSRVVYFSLFRTREREEKYKWIGTISEEEIYFYKKKGSPVSINNLDDARRVKRISTRKEGLVYSFLRNNGFMNLDTTRINESIYLKVILDRNELAIGESSIGVSYLLKKMNQPPDILEKTQVCIFKLDLYIATSRDIPDSEIQNWQNSLDKMKKSGEYERIRKKYM